jgi:two-component system, LytTR family, sensor kinase
MRNVNIPRFRTLLVATIILWALSYAFWLTNYVFEPLPHQLDHSLRGIAVFALGALLSLAFGGILDRMQGRVDAGILAAVAVAASVAGTAVVAFFHTLVMFEILPRWGGPTWTNLLEQIPMAWVFGAWMLLYFALVADATRRDREVRLAQATAAAIDAQHRLLVQQINPHFLFNTLNTISSFVTSRPQEARDLIAELASLLRESVRETDSEYRPLGRECELAEKYLRIIRVRFGNRLKTTMDVPDSLKTRPVPRGLLLTLIENAVTHGVSVVAGDCALNVQCTSRDRLLMVDVQNHYDPRTSSSSPGRRGGLAALDTRLQALYGNDYQLEYGGDETGLWRVRVALPIPVAGADPAREDVARDTTRGAVPDRMPT